MWEDVVQCWQSLESKETAIGIVRDLLEGRKEESESVIAKGKLLLKGRRQAFDAAREAKLWCLLGDLEPENAVQHYTHAWSLSQESSGRAVRSLGACHFAKGDYQNAITYLGRAVSINPLLSRSWFILGCAYLRVEDWEGGREAFSRCVAIDEEDSESWNNLASVYLRMRNTDKKPQSIDAEVLADTSDVRLSLTLVFGRMEMSVNMTKKRVESHLKTSF
jgi:tetratricopeptide (TPR) repeat protein